MFRQALKDTLQPAGAFADFNHFTKKWRKIAVRIFERFRQAVSRGDMIANLLERSSSAWWSSLTLVIPDATDIQSSV